MKVGRYVHQLFDSETNSWVIANLFNNALLEVSCDEQLIIKNIFDFPDENLADSFAAEIKKILIEQLFLIPDEIDEYGLIFKSTRKQTENQENPSLAIVLTHSCNLRCTYCYQEHHGDVFGKEDEEATIALVEKITNAAKTLNITWWGGEPLVRIDLIQRLSKKIIDICLRKGVRYSAYTSTNAVLLTSEVAAILKNGEVKRFQITLDGPEDCHNQQRPGKGGKNTYNAILEGLKILKSTFGESFPYITLRVNISALHIDLPKETWQKFFQDLYQFRKIVRVHFQPTVATFRYGVVNVATPQSFNRLLLGLLRKARTYGFHVISEGDERTPGRIGCTAIMAENWMVLPGRRMTKCTDNLHDKTQDSAALSIDGSIQRLPQNKKWNLEAVLKEPDCANCSVFPVCMGGCSISKPGVAPTERCGAKTLAPLYILTDSRRSYNRMGNSLS